MNREKFTAWRKSRHSQEDSGCVEVAPGSCGSVGVRDSKNPAGPQLAFTPQEWSTFRDGTRAGLHDLR
jgi:hypothetical protein